MIAHLYLRRKVFMESIQKTEFIKAVAERTGNSQKETKEIIDAALDVITDALAQGKKVTLTGFGTFEVRHRQQREGVNPQTREKITIPETKTPGFSASSTLKDRVKDGG
jgi:DNA-binding protein HU-beta